MLRGTQMFPAKRPFRTIVTELNRAADCRYFTPGFNENIMSWAKRALGATEVRLIGPARALGFTVHPIYRDIMNIPGMLK